NRGPRGMGYAALTFALEQQGEPVEALSVADHASAIAPHSCQIRVLRGMLYEELGRWEQSITDLKPCVALHNDVWVHAALADDYGALGQVDDARAEAAQVERIVALYPNSAEGYRALALALLVERKEAEALVALEKAVRLDPSKHGNHLWAKGVVYAR